MNLKPSKPDYLHALTNFRIILKFIKSFCLPVLFLFSAGMQESQATNTLISSSGAVHLETLTKYEAEDAVLSGVTIAKSLSGFSGTGYMDGGSFDAETDKITFTVNVAATASYPLVIRFQNTCGVCEKAQNVSINGGATKYTTFNATTAAWQDLNVGNVDLKAGSNTITISKSWGYTHIDYHVVNFLKKIVDSNGVPIPIIFRPLHEIDGGWFWWTCTTDPTKTAKLYQILQDRIINFHGCHNLIWVYNPGVICNGGSWPPYQTSENVRRKLFYPGDDYCDITGIDLYDFDPAVRGTYNNTGKTYRDAWNMMKAIAPDKMIALCESEGLPNPEKCFTDPDYAPWLYCLPWYSENYTDNASGATRDLCEWNKVQFKSAYVVNAGDFVLTSTELPLDPGIPGINIYPNPSNDYVTISFQNELFRSKIKVLLVDLSGKMVFNTEAPAADRLRIFTGNLVKGVYILRVISDKNDFSGKLIIN